MLYANQINDRAIGSSLYGEEACLKESYEISREVTE
jgi:hypothetical protein